MKKKDDIKPSRKKISDKQLLIALCSFFGAVIFVILMTSLTVGYHVWGNHEWVNATCTSPEYCSGCGKINKGAITHNWNEADCEKPRICTNCGKSIGYPKGHNYKEADCENPKICSICGKSEGAPLGHDWPAIDCEKVQKCYICGKVRFEKAGHNWTEANCQQPKTCTQCGKTEGKTGSHKWLEATPKNPKVCSVCGKTEGDPAKYEQKLQVKADGSKAKLSLLNWDGNDWKPVWSADGYLGKDGVSKDNKKNTTPQGKFNIKFCYGIDEPDTGLTFRQITSKIVLITDPDSDYYNCITNSDNAGNGSDYEKIYDKFKKGDFTTNIFFDYNGDGTSQNKSDSKKQCGISVCGYEKKLEATSGNINISGSDMKNLLKKLDSNKNPVIEIS